MKTWFVAPLLWYSLLVLAAAVVRADSNSGVMPAGKASPAPSYRLRRTAAEVRLVVTVTDRSNKPVHGLSPSDFRVFDGGQLIREFTGFHEDSELPLCVGVLIDVSDSVQGQIALEQQAARDFLQQVLRPDQDDGFVIGFARAVSQAQKYPAITVAGLYAGKTPEGIGTSLFDAVVQGAEQAQTRNPKLGHRVLVLLSDGEDTLSAHTELDALQAAQRAGVVIYTIGVHGQLTQDGEHVLRRLARETGGLAFTAANIDSGTLLLKRIQQDLRSQYSLTYKLPAQSARGEQYRKIRVLWNGNRHGRIRTRSGYFVEPE